MNRRLIKRICAILVVAAVVIGLPMQGTAMASAAGASPAPWSAADVPMPGGCKACGDEPAAGMLCPIVFCIGLSAIIVADLDSARVMRDKLPIRLEQTSTGSYSSPDPFPPRPIDLG